MRPSLRLADARALCRTASVEGEPGASELCSASCGLMARPLLRLTAPAAKWCTASTQPAGMAATSDCSTPKTPPLSTEKARPDQKRSEIWRRTSPEGILEERERRSAQFLRASLLRRECSRPDPERFGERTLVTISLTLCRLAHDLSRAAFSAAAF